MKKSSLFISKMCGKYGLTFIDGSGKGKSYAYPPDFSKEYIIALAKKHLSGCKKSEMPEINCPCNEIRVALDRAPKVGRPKVGNKTLNPLKVSIELYTKLMKKAKRSKLTLPECRREAYREFIEKDL